MRNGILLLFVLLQTMCFGQKLTDYVTYNNFTIVNIKGGAERYDYSEVDVLYFVETSDTTAAIQIHSVTASNNDRENKMDTTFVLNGHQYNQYNKLEKFFNDVKSGNCPYNELFGAGNYSECTIILNQKEHKCWTKAGKVSLIELLLDETK